MKVVSDPRLECSFKEFWDEIWPDRELGESGGIALPVISNALRGETHMDPPFQIMVGDKIVTFDSREMLCRFTAIPTDSQDRFVRAILLALARNKVLSMEIIIPWSASGTKRVRVIHRMGLINFEAH